MTSNYTFSSEDDDFFKSLDKSLTTQLSSVTLPNFISDLIDAINHLEDNTGNGFLFYEEDEYTPSSIHECFMYSTSEIDVCDEQKQRFLYDKDNEKITDNRIDNVMDNVSVDMFAEFQNDEESERVDQMSIHEHENVQIPQEEHSEHMSVTLCDVSMDTFAQNEEVVEECPLLSKSPSVQNSKNQILSQSPTSENSPIVENVDNEKLSECGDMVICMPSDTSTYCEQNLTDLNVNSPRTFQDAKQPSTVNTGLNEVPPERTKLPERMLSTEYLGLSRFFNPIIPAFNSPSRGSFSGASLLQGFSPATIMRSEALQQQRNDCLTRNKVESDLNSTICEEYETTRNTDPEINMTEVYAFDLDEAYTQCFLGSQTANEK